ncbi:hypothetical protein [uncultured Sutterella sp.]|uniref:hypothetical protein n=1 Tax=uncultured Sutterella sp. TaxID=286133 RepID=UPI0025F1E63A|nr:hypothetical protein [uncultured Sutterella sp.]
MTPAKKEAAKGLENENESKNLRPIEQNRFEAFGAFPLSLQSGLSRSAFYRQEKRAASK